MGSQVRRMIRLEGPLYVDPEGVLDLEGAFGRPVPVLLDLGAARARYFITVGKGLPDVGFVGVEMRKKRVEAALARLAKHDITNCRMLWGFSERVLAEHFEDEQVAAISVMFPDPWPKKRHAKRRIYRRSDVLHLIARRLQPGGLFWFKTDVKSYLEEVEAALGAEPLLAMSSSATVRVAGSPPFSLLENPHETYYETKWRQEGRSFYQLFARRLSGTGDGTS